MSAILESRADIIFLSDTRIVTNKGVSSSQRIVNKLRDCKHKKYESFFNSSSNSRGVALLINRDFNEFSIIKEYKNTDENFHLISCKINGFSYCLGAIYGPNNTSHAFYNELTDVLTDVNAAGIVNVIIGGDWNTTWDRRPVNSNIDTFCMSGLPNAKNSELLERLCMRFSLTDPFRALYPDKRDFTYAPFGDVRLNRSRLDFFVVSNNILDQVSDCVISNAPRCKLFDHKSVRLELFRPQFSKHKKTSLAMPF
jgi:exonuclease III